MAQWGGMAHFLEFHPFSVSDLGSKLDAEVTPKLPSRNREDLVAFFLNMFKSSMAILIGKNR